MRPTQLATVIVVFIVLCFALGCDMPAAAATHDEVWDAICQVESGGDPTAHNMVNGEDARGIAQITPIFIVDINRILGEKRYVHDDAWDVDKSRAMFDIYNAHYHPLGGPERIARCWQGGPKAHKK